MAETKFYRCIHCGNNITFLHSSGVPVMCCGEKMQELAANTSDGAAEKHVPVAAVAEKTVTVSVGSVAHPMLAEHYIQWICLETTAGVQFKYLEPGNDPKALFSLADGEKPVAAYAYCNLHGLWKTDI